MSERVVIYSRVSSDEQVQQGLSIPAQRNALLAHIERDGAMVLVGEFVDEGQSAYAPAAKRKDFQEMIARCKEGGVDTVLVHKLDRFSRNREESVVFKGMLRKHGVVVKSVTEAYDPETPQGALFEGILETLSQYFSENLAQEVRKGMGQNASLGRWNGGPAPYGYAIKKEIDESGRVWSRLVPGSEEEVTTVTRIFDFATEQGWGCKQIVNWLNERGYRTRAGNAWSTSTVGRLLNNPVYTGDLVWGQNLRGSKVEYRDNAQSVVLENAHEALVSKEQWERRKELGASRRFRRRDSPTRPGRYLLHRLVRCGECGHNFVGIDERVKHENGKRYCYPYYLCNGYRQKGRSECQRLAIRREWAEKAVVNAIRNQICQPERLAQLRRSATKKLEDYRKKVSRESTVDRKQLAEIQTQTNRLYDAIALGMDLSECQKRIRALDEQRADILSNENLIDEEVFERTRKHLEQAVDAFSGQFAAEFFDLPAEVQRQLVVACVSGIEVQDRERFEIQLRTPVGFRHSGTGREPTLGTETGVESWQVIIELPER